MRKFLTDLTCIAVLLALVSGGPALAGEVAPIRIGLLVNQPSLRITLDPADQVFDMAEGAPRQLTPATGELIFSIKDGLITLNDQPLSTGPIVIKSSGPLLTWNLRNYRGELMLLGLKGKLSLINVLPLEDYLRGVLPKEVSPEWPLAALKAQAIAARTYTVASLNRHGGEGYDLCPSTHCQVYGGASVETPATDRAVAETVGEVMTFNGKIISAQYHSSAGGMTEDPSDVWGFTAPYLKPVLDWDQNSPHWQWTRSVEWSDLQAMALRSYPQIGRLRRITAVAFENDGSLSRVNLTGDLGELTLNGERFRFLLNLPSSNLQIGLIYGPDPLITVWWAPGNTDPIALVADDSIPGLAAEVLNPPWNLPDPWSWLQDKEPLRVAVKGRGWGHRVGLSQWGAKGMAEAGFDEHQILKHYYQDIVVMDVKDIKK